MPDAAPPTAPRKELSAPQKAMHKRLKDNAHVTLHDYAGLDHGFADTFGARRDAAGADLADSRTEAFFAQYLG